MGRIRLPSFEVPDGFTNEGYLEHLVQQGLARRYGEERAKSEEIQERARYELKTILDMGFVTISSSFGIMWIFPGGTKSWWAPAEAAPRAASWPMRLPSRISIRSNITCSLSGFEPRRVSMPDIDIDFCIERRGEVIDYVAEKYGQDKVAQIITFGTLGAKQVVRDVARVMRIPIPDADRIAKLIPFALKMTIQKR